jgi:hypothetical protein
MIYVTIAFMTVVLYIRAYMNLYPCFANFATDLDETWCRGPQLYAVEELRAL